MGLIGHSTGGAAVIIAADNLKSMGSPPAQINGLALIAPVAFPSLSPPDHVLVINGTREHPCQAGLGPLEIYCQSFPPKHLVYVTGANHFGYIDGICIDPDSQRGFECFYDSYQLDPRDYLPYASGWDNSSQVGGVTGPVAHALQQLAAGNYLEAFFWHYLQGNTEALDYLIQTGVPQQCGHPDNSGECANEFINNGPPVIPPPSCEPLRYFDDLESLNVQVNVCSCLE